MALGHSAGIPNKGNLIWAVDVHNDKSWPNSGSPVYDMTGKTTYSTQGNSSMSVITSGGWRRYVWGLDVAGGTHVYTINPALNHELWTLSFWCAKKATPTVDYQGIIDLYETSLNTYFYRIDDRQTTNNYPLGYQKDDTISSWLTHNWGVANTNWDTNKFYLLTTVHNNGVFTTYRNGSVISTQTQTLSVDGYGDIDEVRVNHNSSCPVYLGACWLWDTDLDSSAVKQLFYATRRYRSPPFEVGDLE